MAVEDEQQSNHGGVCGSRAHSSIGLDLRVTQAGSLGPPGQAAHVLLWWGLRIFFSFTSGLECDERATVFVSEAEAKG